MRGHGHARSGQGRWRDKGDRELQDQHPLLKDASGQDISAQGLSCGTAAARRSEDLLATVLLKTAYDWEQLPLPGFPLQDFSTDGGTATYTVSFQLNGAGPPVDGSVAVHVGADARYVSGSTQLSGGPGTVDEPTLRSPENELNWHLTNVELGTSYQLTFHAKPGLSLGTESATAKIAATGLNGTVQAPGGREHADHRAW